METELFTPAVIWFLVGTALLLLELAIPGLIIVFFGAGAWITAACLLLFDLNFNSQLLIFLLTSLGSLFTLRHSIRKKYMDFSVEGADPQNNAFIGSKAISLTEISPEKDGKVEFNGSQWEASTNSLIKANTNVRIIGMKSIKLIVEPFNQ
ncbi:MAG: NfeD family protein [Vicingaceae bacterium]